MSRQVAKGTVQLATEQALVLGTGYLATVLLARSLGPEHFGLYGVIVSVISWIQHLGRAGIPLAASRLIAGEEVAAERGRDLRATALVTNLVLVLGTTLLFWALAPLLAQLLSAREATPLLRLAALDIPLYGMFHLYRGVAMGERRFLVSGAAGVVYGVTRLACVCSLVLLGFSVAAALVANIAASLVSLLVLASRVRISVAPPERRIAASLGRLAVPLTLCSVGLAILHSLDLWVLKALSPEGSGPLIGIYAAVGFVARAPELALIAVASVLFPAISHALATDDLDRARGYVRDAVRFLWVILIPVSAIIAADAEPIMRLLFSDDYAGGGDVLRVQIAGAGGLAFVATFLSILRAAGSFYQTVWVSIALVALMAALALTWVPSHGALGAAASLLGTTAIGACLTAVPVFRRFGALLAPRTVIGVLGATGLVLALGLWLPATGILLVVKCGGLLALYAIALALCGELTRKDLDPLLFWR